jgi:hypothetical protein
MRKILFAASLAHSQRDTTSYRRGYAPLGENEFSWSFDHIAAAT